MATGELMPPQVRHDMKRRDFITMATSLLASQTGGLSAWAQTIASPPAADAKPAYDAGQVGEQFQSSVAQGIDFLQSQYQSAVSSMSKEDAERLQRIAEPIFKYAQQLRSLPFVDDTVTEALLEEPQLETIFDSHGGPTVYHINGMFTPKPLAIEEAKLLAKQLGGAWTVKLLYNEGTDPRTDLQAAGRDLDEAYRDRIWPVYLAGMTRGASLRSFTTRLMQGQGALQHNPTTRQLAHLLYHHPEECVSLVGYSQGSLIVRNALYTLAMLGKQDFVEKHVAFVAPGLPVNDHEIWPVPKKFTPLTSPNDPVSACLGLREPKIEWNKLGLAHHRWYEDGYVSRIKPEMLLLDEADANRAAAPAEKPEKVRVL